MGIGRMLVVLGIILIVAGLLFLLGDRLGIRIGRLPGDIVVRGKNSVFYFPLVTCLLISIILTLIFSFFGRR
jgi:hypothetical protein